MSTFGIRTARRQGDLINLISVARPTSSTCRHISMSCPTKAQLPYFQKKLKPKSTESVTISPPEPRSAASSSSSSSSSSKSSKQHAAQEPTPSKRQAFKAITPPTRVMDEIRIQGLGAKAENWSFDKSRNNKTFRPWEAPEKPQEPRRLPSRQIWFEQRNSKIVEKEEVRFPMMRFVAGASSMTSVPSEEALLGLVRPDLFSKLEEIDNLLQAGRGGDGDGDGDDQEGEATGHIPLTLDVEQIRKLKEQRRAKELEIKDSVLQEIAIVGRSNVGKSTMLNTLTDSPNTARVSSKPGLTRQLNFYRCADKFVLVDMPGYGFAFAKEEHKQRWKDLIEEYLGTRKSLRRIYVMIDARHGIKVPDREFLDMLENKSKKFQVVLTKCDLVSPPDLGRRYMLVQEELRNNYRHAIAERLLMVSSYTRAGMNNLRKDMLFACGENILVRERERPKSTLR